MRNKIFLVSLLLVFCIVFSGCGNSSGGGISNDSYERLLKDVMEHGYVIEDLPDTYLTKFSKDDVVVCFGDSITGNAQAPEDYPSVIAEKTGLSVVNAGFGGCRMSEHPAAEYDAFSMYRLADAVVSGDWTLQDQSVGELSMDIAAQRLEDLKNVDWNNVDIITIAYGTNDINGKVPMDSESDPLSCKTVSGALRYSIEKIQTAYPYIKIVVVTPIYRFWVEDGSDSDTRDFNGNKFIEWVDDMIAVAEEYHMPYVDLYRKAGFNSCNRLYYYYATDGVHPNPKGLKVIGDKIAAAIINEC